MRFHERVIMFSAVRLAPEIVSKRSWFSHGLQNLKSSRSRLKTNKQECKYQDRRAEPQLIQIYLNFIDFYFFFS